MWRFLLWSFDVYRFFCCFCCWSFSFSLSHPNEKWNERNNNGFIFFFVQMKNGKTIWKCTYIVNLHLRIHTKRIKSVLQFRKSCEINFRHFGKLNEQQIFTCDRNFISISKWSNSFKFFVNCNFIPSSLWNCPPIFACHLINNN